jgi:hypothetical protein
MLDCILGFILVVFLLLVIVPLFSLVVTQRDRTIQAEYDATVEQAAEIPQVAKRDDIYAHAAEDLAWLNNEHTLLPDFFWDPDASNGGAYIINLLVGELDDIVVRISMAEHECC